MQKWPDLRRIYLNGDIAEIESVSKHPKTPLAQKSLLAEFDYLREKLDELTKIFGDLPVDYLSGNHEARVFRFIRDIAPEMWGLVSTPSFLGFDKRINYKWHDYGPGQLVGVGKTRDLFARHEPLVGGINHAKGTAEKALVSIIYGHTHVEQRFTHKKFGPKPISVTAYSNGWLGDITKDCFDYRGTKENWQLGFSRVDCDERTGDYEVRFIYL